jgi:hypothetical protein
MHINDIIIVTTQLLVFTYRDITCGHISPSWLNVASVTVDLDHVVTTGLVFWASIAIIRYSISLYFARISALSLSKHSIINCDISECLN